MWELLSDLNQAEPGVKMLHAALVKETVDWEGQEAGLSPHLRELAKDAGHLSRYNFPCRLPGTREPKRSLA